MEVGPPSQEITALDPRTHFCMASLTVTSPLSAPMAHSPVRSPHKCLTHSPPSHVLLPLVALVTRANKGIGFTITCDLGHGAHGTRRGAGPGSCAAAAGLGPESLLPPSGHRRPAEHRALRKVPDSIPLHIQAEVTMKTNFFGTRDDCTELLPLIKLQGRVVNVSSIMNFMDLKNCSPELQQKFTSETITEEDLVGLMNKFTEDTKNGVHIKEAWPNIRAMAYGVSKMGITVLSRIYARKLSEKRRGDKILLNACCPGTQQNTFRGKEIKPKLKLRINVRFSNLNNDTLPTETIAGTHTRGDSQGKIKLDINLTLSLCLNQPQIEELWTALGQRIPLTLAELVELKTLS
ncbi:hypothetical protein HPG69_016150 [Diceros bicornis minor]|uniref:Uncharacterized protein n=1 Tax=Diceros bicornis minor TaxID=77932 RepID=A0A7J7FHT1_DICBM|nr:hypothetical protein HPG69_016150 [Diceros bicornis minor]